jgi:hypothetical protein
VRRPFVILAFASLLAGSVLAAGRRPPAPPAPPPGAPPSVALRVETSAAGPWKVRVENTGSLPLRLTADARLLSLELEAPGGGTVRCALPDDMRPSTDVEQALLLPPGRAWEDRFDPALYCFGPKESQALASGTAVPRLGWSAARSALTPPFVVSPPPREAEPPDASTAWPAPAKEIAGPSFPLPAPPAAPPPPVLPAPREPFPSKLRVSIAPRIDVAEAFDLAVAFAIVNDGERAEAIVPHAGILALDVQGPSGAVRCALGMTPRPVRENLVSLPPRGGRTSVSVLVDRLCPVGTFARPGLYRLTPRLDTRRIGPVPRGVRMFAGEVVGEAGLLRIRRGSAPWPAPTLARVDDAGPGK